MITTYIGLGANLGDREANINCALVELVRSDFGSTLGLVGVSSIYETEPVGFQDQPDFLNAVARIETDLGPHELLAALEKIEAKVGRKETFKWGPRIVDLDILLYGDESLEEDNLTIPHPEMHKRAFVLTPLAEIAPEAKHPVLGLTARELSERVGSGGIRAYEAPAAD